MWWHTDTPESDLTLFSQSTCTGTAPSAAEGALVHPVA